jgi:peptidoglycan/LPS O-acetylase OafA/YrhL
MKKIPSLDGLRAISIIMVLLWHTMKRVAPAGPVGLVWGTLGNGNIGVYIFFVISGFLITTLLVREHEKNGTISLRDFYLRRAFRILPPVYFYVGILVLLSSRWPLGITGSSVAGALLFYANLVSRPWSLDHFWTLSIEEQFYFIWPVALVCSLRRGGRSTACRVAIVVILLCPLIRLVSAYFGSAYLRHINGRSFQGRADALIFGCLVALSSGTRTFERIYDYAARIWWVFPAVLIFVSAPLDAKYGNFWDYPVGYTLDGACISLWLIWCVRNPESMLGKVLNFKPIAYIGILSYSIYIWQQLFLIQGPGYVWQKSSFNTVPVSFALLSAAALFSYYLVERPSLRLRDRVERKLGFRKKPGAEASTDN